jgi:hypothetical protein
MRSGRCAFQSGAKAVTLVRFGAILGHSTTSLLRFFATLSQAASSYPAGNGSAQIRRNIAANTRRVTWPSAIGRGALEQWWAERQRNEQ